MVLDVTRDVTPSLASPEVVSGVGTQTHRNPGIPESQIHPRYHEIRDHKISGNPPIWGIPGETRENPEIRGPKMDHVFGEFPKYIVVSTA